MSSNNGQKLLVFGLGFAQHDNRKMQQVLRHYNRMPSTPGSRAALFVELTKLGKELESDESRRAQAQQLADWMRDGGDFPLGLAPTPINGSRYIHAQPTQTPPSDRPQDSPLNSRYGPGHILTYPDDTPADAPQNGDDGDAGNSVSELQDGSGPEASGANGVRGQAAELEANSADGGGDAAADHVAWHPERTLDDPEPQPADSEPDEDQPEVGGLEDDETDRMDLERWGAAPESSAGPFRGRGRTFDDIDESAMTTQNQDQPTATDAAVHPHPNPGVDVPQLRGDQMWRGNNVHGLGPAGLGMPFRPGFGGGLPRNMMAHQGHRGRRGRPRMEHDLEDEDDFDDPWGVAPGHFALGRGRTLNDPEPAQGETAISDQAMESDDEPIDPESDIEGDLPSILDDSDDTLIECPVCLEEFPPSGFPKRALVTDQCDHPDKACLQCLDSSIAAIVETGALHILACPICPQKLTRRDVKEYANKKVYERYKYLKQQALIPGHYISCTNPNCGGSQAHDSSGPSGPKMVCKFCQFETCVKHRRPWHEGKTCVQFDTDPVQMERLEEEEATAKLLAREQTSICPKCGQGVTKTDGCDHMMCQCGTEWCYVCSCSWENILRIGATAHATFCIYHPNKVNLTKSQQEAARNRIMGLVHGGEVSPELTRARDEFRQRRREEMRPKLAEAAEARRKQALEQKRQGSSTAGQPAPKKTKVKLVPAWEEGGTTKRAL